MAKGMYQFVQANILDLCNIFSDVQGEVVCAKSLKGRTVMFTSCLFSFLFSSLFLLGRNLFTLTGPCHN